MTNSITPEMIREMEEFRKAVIEARQVWMDENPCEDGRDHATPFDRFLYGGLPQRSADER